MRVPPIAPVFRAGLAWIARLTIRPTIWCVCLASVSIGLVRRGVWALQRPPGEPPAEILYVAKDDLSVLYVLENARLLAEHGHARCAVTARGHLRPDIERRAADAGIRLRFTPLHVAMFTRWQLIVYTHHFRGFCFDRSTPSVYISHGLETGKKTLHDTGYTYGFKGLRSPREPMYHTMIATHAAELDAAGREYPAYRSVVRLSTEAVLERLLGKAEHRDALRAGLGLRNDKPVVLCMSTWGSPSLMATHGEDLAREAAALQQDFQLVITVHPKLAGARRTQSVLRALRAHGVHVLSPNCSWIDYMAVADIAVSDITSMCLYSALLGTPIVFLGASVRRLVPGGLVEEVSWHSPRARTVRTLRTRLWDAHGQPNPDLSRRIRREFPHAGDAAHLIRTLTSLAAAHAPVGAAAHE